ncbi:hypothetical protein PAXRUDRAFT_590081 [Paxillus rubicundulus Ve08.2h10]|uniref:Uncharacterized protein n=1 Tax=Paxillus rubicundulus Ve08.2h10 TaxID=930991 RepID=A0A0D0D602_9AGAM|nr:hypothetical protein PAXRUDRAFT_590081 [Paxillus rubicundulus Ve08.2h10]
MHPPSTTFSSHRADRWRAHREGVGATWPWPVRPVSHSLAYVDCRLTSSNPAVFQEYSAVSQCIGSFRLTHHLAPPVVSHEKKTICSFMGHASFGRASPLSRVPPIKRLPPSSLFTHPPFLLLPTATPLLPTHQQHHTRYCHANNTTPTTVYPTRTPEAAW